MERRIRRLGFCGYKVAGKNLKFSHLMILNHLMSQVGKAKTASPMDKILIQKALPRQATALSQIAQAAKAYWGYPQAWLDHWKDDLSFSPQYIATHPVHQLRVSGKLAGCCAIEKGEGLWEVAHLWIEPSFIGKGLGAILLTASLQAVVPLGAKLQVVSDPYAEGFYEKMGFKRVGEVESYPPGRILPKMEMNYPPG